MERQITGGTTAILNALKEREIAAQGSDAASGTSWRCWLNRVKQRQESVKVYLEGGRPELAAKETAEIAVIEEFYGSFSAPRSAAVAAAIAESRGCLGQGHGRDMGVLKAKYTGAMDFGRGGNLIRASSGKRRLNQLVLASISLDKSERSNYGRGTASLEIRC